MSSNNLLSGNAVVAFVAVTNADRAKEFYVNKLGLTLVEEQLPFAVVFDAAGTMLRATLVKELTPAHFTVLGWSVKDIDAKVAELTANGVVFESFPWMNGATIWNAPGGARVAWFKDPDGNVLSLSYHP